MLKLKNICSTDNLATQTVLQHIQSYSTDNLAVQTILQHRQSCSTNNLAAQTILHHRQSYSTDNLAAQTILQQKQSCSTDNLTATREATCTFTFGDNLVPLQLWWHETVLKSEKGLQMFCPRFSENFLFSFYLFQNALNPQTMISF